MDNDQSGDADQRAPGGPEQIVLGMPKADRLVLLIGISALAAVGGPFSGQRTLTLLPSGQ